MIKTLILLFSFLIVFPLRAQLTHKSKDVHIEIPYQLVENMRVPIIEVLVNGKPYRFMVDTGSPYTSVTRLVVEQCGLTISNKTRDIKDAYSIKKELPLAIAKDLSVGGLSFGEVKVEVYESDNLVFKCSNLNGIIGGNLLKRFVVKFDNKHKIMTLTKNTSSVVPKGQQWKKMDTSFSKSYCEIGVNANKRTDILFDSGNGFRSLLLDSVAYGICKEKNLLTFINEEEGYGSNFIGAHGKPVYIKQLRATMEEFSFGGYKLQNVPVQVGAVTSFGFVLANYGDIILDYPRKHYCFIPYEGDMEWGDVRTKASCGVHDSKLIIKFIWDKELGKTITVGDEIKMVGNQPFGNMDNCSMIELLSLLKQHITPDNRTVLLQKPSGEQYAVSAEVFY